MTTLGACVTAVLASATAYSSDMPLASPAADIDMHANPCKRAAWLGAALRTHAARFTAAAGPSVLARGKWMARAVESMREEKQEEVRHARATSHSAPRMK